jgi:flagellar hook-length control protein FliK
VENSLPKLREILADNNIMLGNATVSDQPPRERSAWEFTNQNPDTKEQRKVFTNRIEPDKTLLTATSIIPRHQHSGILDTFA